MLYNKILQHRKFNGPLWKRYMWNQFNTQVSEISTCFERIFKNEIMYLILMWDTLFIYSQVWIYRFYLYGLMVGWSLDHLEGTKGLQTCYLVHHNSSPLHVIYISRWKPYWTLAGTMDYESWELVLSPKQ